MRPDKFLDNSNRQSEQCKIKFEIYRELQLQTFFLNK